MNEKDTIVKTLMDMLGATESQALSLREWVFDNISEHDDAWLRNMLATQDARLYPTIGEYEANEDTDDPYIETYYDVSYGVLVLNK